MYHQNKVGDTPLHIAAKTAVEQNLWIVVALLAKAEPAHLNIVNGGGDTALHVAVRHRNAHTALMVMLGKADVNIQDADGKTALHLAAANGDESLFEMLVERGVNIHLQTKLGQTVADLVVKKIALVEEKMAGTADRDEQRTSEDEKNCYIRMGGRLSEKIQTETLPEIGKKSRDVTEALKRFGSAVMQDLSQIIAGEKRAVAGEVAEKVGAWNSLGKAAAVRAAKPVEQEHQTGNTILHVLVQSKGNYEMVADLLGHSEKGEETEAEKGLRELLERKRTKIARLLTQKPTTDFFKTQDKTAPSLTLPLRACSKSLLSWRKSLDLAAYRIVSR